MTKLLTSYMYLLRLEKMKSLVGPKNDFGTLNIYVLFSVSNVYWNWIFRKKKKRSSFSFMYALCWGSLDFIGHLKSSKPLSRKTGQIFADRLELIWLLFFTCYRSSQICLGGKMKRGMGCTGQQQRSIEWKTDFSKHFSF